MTKGTKAGDPANDGEQHTNPAIDAPDHGDSAMSAHIDGIRVVTDPARQRLTERQLVDYHNHRSSFLRWALNIGKNPEQAEGYARSTIKGYAYRLSQFYRFVWDSEERYTTDVTHDHADSFVQELAYGDSSTEDKASHVKALKTLFRWRSYEFGADEWDSEISFNPNSGTTNPKDYLTQEERQAIRDAALDYGSVPAYNALTPEERDRWKIYLAQRFEMPKSDIGPDEFDRANSWKVPSLIWTALDTGLRPIEVNRASTRWVDIGNRVLRIPREDSSKNEDNWIVSLTDRTTNTLERWLAERQQYDKYEDTDALWLNRQGNRYKYYSLNRLLDSLCDEVGIETENRDVTFYSIRHSVGTLMAREEGLAAAQMQLRHRSEQSTLRYDQAPIEDRRDALNRMG